MLPMVIILAFVIILLLWKIYTEPKIFASGTNDWLILRWHKIDQKSKMWVSEAPMHLEFVPIIGWEYINEKATPLTATDYNVWKRLKNESAEYETSGYYIREGVVFDINDMSQSDFWLDITETVTDTDIVIEIHGSIPNCYRQEVNEIIQIAEEKKIK